MKIHPDNHVKIWNHFLSNSEDWCISRQLWWGHQIPAFKALLKNGQFYQENDDIYWFVGRDEKEAL